MCKYYKYNSSSDLYTINLKDYDNLEFQDPTNNIIKKIKSHPEGQSTINQFASLKNYMDFLHCSGTIVSQFDWTKIINKKIKHLLLVLIIPVYLAPYKYLR